MTKNKNYSKIHFCVGQLENIVGKGENAGFHHFPLFQLFFQMLSQ